MIQRIFLLLFCFFSSAMGTLFAAEISDINVRDREVGTTGVRNDNLENFVAPFSEFFFAPSTTG